MHQVHVQQIQRHLHVVPASLPPNGDASVKLEMPAAGLHAWLLAMPPASLQRLRVINSNTASSKHIIQALAFGLIDGNIRRLNRMITHLLLTRMRAERQGKTQTIARINGLMEDMHEIIDCVTGIERTSCKSEGVCNRPKKRLDGRGLMSNE